MRCQVLLYRLHQHYQEEPAEELAVAPEAEAVAEMFPQTPLTRYSLKLTEEAI